MPVLSWGLALAAIAMGMLMPLQAGINASLARHAGTPYLAAVTNTLVASLSLLVAILVVRVPPVHFARLLAAPWWTYVGGVCGAGLVLSAIVLSPRLGAAGYVTALIVGTVSASLLIDHFGLIGFAERAVTIPRLIGAGLVIAGMVLINRF